MPFPTELKDLMLAVYAKRTVKYFGKFHFCIEHKKFVVKDHTDDYIYLLVQ